ncbi:hypothetical protein [Vallitalea okinawensis]|uniref:hypothetical protein n=1 Tax=Vallitalea okinawensis TaxID=2078660 RepID=UPI000CFDFC3E|nr:hypothetical protein [Vallitalea okinawensis]
MYFKVLSLVWGILAITVRPLIHLIPKQWNDFELNKAYKKKQPKWVWGVGALSLALVSITWYIELTTAVPYSLIISMLVTLTLIKIFQLLFNYDKFRLFVVKALVEDRSIITKINIASTILGLILVALGLFLY